MRITLTATKILDWHEGGPPGVKANPAGIVSTGKPGGTGKPVSRPADRNLEGPAHSFAPNPAAYDPHYHCQLAIEAGPNVHAPLGMLAARADTCFGKA